MKILMMTERYLPIWGGAENQLMQLIPHLTQSGAHIRVITRRWKKEWPQHETFDETEIIRLGVPGFGKLATILFTLHVFLFCVSQRKTFDLMHSHGAIKMGALCNVLSWILRKKTVAKIATAGHFDKLSANCAGRIILTLFKKSDAIIAMTEEINNELSDNKVTPSKIIHITNGVNCERFFPATLSEKNNLREHFGLLPYHVILIFTGRLVKRKGLEFIIDSWPTIQKRSPNASLLILGNGKAQPDSVEESLKKKVKEKKMKNIFFVGESDKPEHYLQASDIFIFPSRLEGFPNAVMEAMSSGLAVLSSDIGGVQKLIEHKKTGLKFALDNMEEYQKYCLSLIESECLRKQLGSEARHQMQQQYSFQSIGKAYIELYNRLLS